VAEAEGPEAGLVIVRGLDLDDYPYRHAAEGELLSRLGRNGEARAAYARAIALTTDDAERRLLERRVAELEGPAARRP
jgi:RNA polymerase sigma-70 factor (ECF subfamily)